jgi:hypothetical protein
MAKKKGTPSKAAAVESVKRPVRVDLLQEDHDRLRIAAAKARLSMASYARMVVMKAVEQAERAE